MAVGHVAEIAGDGPQSAGVSLAEARGLKSRIEAMFTGEKINATEKRAVLHVALRAPAGKEIRIDGVDVVPQVHAVLDKMADFSRRVRSGAPQARWQSRSNGSGSGIGRGR